MSERKRCPHCGRKAKKNQKQGSQNSFWFEGGIFGRIPKDTPPSRSLGSIGSILTANYFAFKQGADEESDSKSSSDHQN